MKAKKVIKRNKKGKNLFLTHWYCKQIKMEITAVEDLQFIINFIKGMNITYSFVLR